MINENNWRCAILKLEINTKDISTVLFVDGDKYCDFKLKPDDTSLVVNFNRNHKSLNKKNLVTSDMLKNACDISDHINLFNKLLAKFKDSPNKNDLFALITLVAIGADLGCNFNNLNERDVFSEYEEWLSDYAKLENDEIRQHIEGYYGTPSYAWSGNEYEKRLELQLKKIQIKQDYLRDIDYKLELGKLIMTPE